MLCDPAPLKVMKRCLAVNNNHRGGKLEDDAHLASVTMLLRCFSSESSVPKKAVASVRSAVVSELAKDKDLQRLLQNSLNVKEPYVSPSQTLAIRVTCFALLSGGGSEYQVHRDIFAHIVDRCAGTFGAWPGSAELLSDILQCIASTAADSKRPFRSAAALVVASVVVKLDTFEAERDGELALSVIESLRAVDEHLKVHPFVLEVFAQHLAGRHHRNRNYGYLLKLLRAATGLVSMHFRSSNDNNGGGKDLPDAELRRFQSAIFEVLRSNMPGDARVACLALAAELCENHGAEDGQWVLDSKWGEKWILLVVTQGVIEGRLNLEAAARELVDDDDGRGATTFIQENIVAPFRVIEHALSMLMSDFSTWPEAISAETLLLLRDSLQEGVLAAHSFLIYAYEEELSRSHAQQQAAEKKNKLLKLQVMRASFRVFACYAAGAPESVEAEILQLIPVLEIFPDLESPIVFLAPALLHITSQIRVSLSDDSKATIIRLCTVNNPGRQNLVLNQLYYEVMKQMQ
eukprot:g1493.t1